MAPKDWGALYYGTAVLQLYYGTSVVQLYKYGIVIHYGDPSQIHDGKSVKFTTVSQSDSRWLTGQIHNGARVPSRCKTRIEVSITSPYRFPKTFPLYSGARPQTGVTRCNVCTVHGMYSGILPLRLLSS
jgi:hypothetical protein